MDHRDGAGGRRNEVRVVVTQRSKRTDGGEEENEDEGTIVLHKHPLRSPTRKQQAFSRVRQRVELIQKEKSAIVSTKKYHLRVPTETKQETMLSPKSKNSEQITNLNDIIAVVEKKRPLTVKSPPRKQESTDSKTENNKHMTEEKKNAIVLRKRSSKSVRTRETAALTKTTTALVVHEPVIKNFRQAKGLVNFYRCGRVDDVADRVGVDKSEMSKAEKILLYKAGLILDLRSFFEIKQDKMGIWTQDAPGGKFEFIEVKSDKDLAITKEKRALLNLDVLGPKDFSIYADQHWFTSAQERIQLTYYKAIDEGKLHSMRVDALNKRGPLGLNEVILESGKEPFCRALKAITLHLEKKGDTQFRPVIIHCAQGKDRTGMLVMLLQSILGVSDEDIINDYHESEDMYDFSTLDSSTRPGRLDKAKMKRAPKIAMEQTLAYLRKKYGSIFPGYLQAIGFTDSWRIRLATALLLAMEKPKQPKKSRASRL